jgi:hypothetical protein
MFASVVDNVVAHGWKQHKDGILNYKVDKEA